MATFGDVIKNKRLELGLTQTQLAKKLGIAQNYIAYLEKNERKPSNAILKKLGNCLSIPIDNLYLLANPEVKNIFPKEAIQEALSLPIFLRDLKNDKLLRKKHDISDDDIKMLASIKARGEVQSVDDYIFLLMTLRQCYK